MDMVKKSDEERLLEIEEQMEKIKARKQQLQNRLKEKERKERTKRLIEVGAIFEKYFEIEGPEEAEKIAIAFQKSVFNNKQKALSTPIAKLKEQTDKNVEKK